jgi:F-type H+-transporting ATP synthase subunit e
LHYLGRCRIEAELNADHCPLSLLQVLRYSALGLGVFYGFYHQRKITSSDKAAAAKREYEHKQSLINQAKAEYSKLKAPAPAATASSSGRKFPEEILGTMKQPGRSIANMPLLVNQDPMDPKFDLEAYFEALMKQKP